MSTRGAKPATAADIAAAIAAASAAQEEKGIAKHAPGIVVAIILGLIFWVGATLLNLNNTVTKMSANVDGLTKSISDLQANQGQSSKTIGDLLAASAAAKARQDAAEADMNRVKERVRILEGQKPLTNQDANGPYD
jgi:predicted RND superfamily exporter protein